MERVLECRGDKSMNEITLNVLKVVQPIGNMYIAKIQGNELSELAQADIRKLYNKEDYIGIQRELDPERVKRIKKYIATTDASFPNSIILNLDSKFLIEETDEYIKFERDPKAFSIIDGQHRLAGFEQNNILFEVIVTIFIDLDNEQQAVLFKTINSEQKKVNPSFKYDLESYSTVKTPEKVIRELTLAFNIDEQSPWQGRIKLGGRKDELSYRGVISQKAFADPIVQYVYDINDAYEIRDELKKYKEKYKEKDNFDINGVFDISRYNREKYIFWQLYIKDKEEMIYKILLNYFEAVYETLKEDWELEYQSVLIKTTGYNAIMKLFKDVFLILYNEKNFTKERFKEILHPLNCLSGEITAQNFGASGESATNSLYRRFCKILDL